MRTKLLSIIIILALGVQYASAEALGPIVLTPLDTHFEAHAAGGAYHAWTHANDPDLWTFDFSAFAGNVDVTISINDYYTPYPDDYDITWDATFLGNTMTAAPGRTFNFSTPAGVHELLVEYVNVNTGISPEANGSWYSIYVDVEGTSIPEPSSLALLLSATLFYRKRTSA